MVEPEDDKTNELIKLLASSNGEHPRAAQEMLPLVYEDLRRLAERKLAQEPPGLTLQATALVHEAYLRLLAGGAVHWENRRHFFAAAAEAMRRILIERARRYKCVKHGGGRKRVDLDVVRVPVPNEGHEQLVALDAALQALQAQDPQLAELVTLRYFAGLTIEQTAELLSMSPATVKRHWTFARMWLAQQISRASAGRESDSGSSESS